LLEAGAGSAGTEAAGRGDDAAGAVSSIQLVAQLFKSWIWAKPASLTAGQLEWAIVPELLG